MTLVRSQAPDDGLISIRYNDWEQRRRAENERKPDVASSRRVCSTKRENLASPPIARTRPLFGRNVRLPLVLGRVRIGAQANGFDVDRSEGRFERLPGEFFCSEKLVEASKSLELPQRFCG